MPHGGFRRTEGPFLQGGSPAPYGTFLSGETYLPPQKTQAFTSLMDFLQNPLSGVQQAISPLLDALIPGEARARGSLKDLFRQAGSLQDTSFAKEARRLEGDILTRRGQTAAQAGLQYLAPLISGRVGALAGIPALERRFQAAGGGGTAAGGGGISDPFGMLSSDPFASTYARSGLPRSAVDPFRTSIDSSSPFAYGDPYLDAYLRSPTTAVNPGAGISDSGGAGFRTLQDFLGGNEELFY